MKTRLIGASVVLGLLATAQVAQAADAHAEEEGRTWFYGAFTAALTPNWSFTVMQGLRYELARWDAAKDSVGNAPETRQFYMTETFAGPNYTRKMGNLTLRGSLWYYYIGYPQRKEAKLGQPDDKYNYSSNIEVIPMAEYRIGRFTIMDRVIFHNTIFADAYQTNSERWGFGTVLRELLQVRFAATDRLGILVGDEPFFGIHEDGQTSKLAGGYSPLGYWKDGFRLNRVYLGVDYKITPSLTVTPMYMFETTVSATDSTDVTANGHYLFVTLSYLLKLFPESPK
jgi:hypothetical protein